MKIINLPNDMHTVACCGCNTLPESSVKNGWVTYTCRCGKCAGAEKSFEKAVVLWNEVAQIKFKQG
jgi:hypothetical protein